MFLSLVLGIRVIHEPDIWWILKTGEWILENGVPTTDPFSFTFFGTPWINVKWLFEVITYLLTRLLGVEWLTLLQVLANISIVYFLNRIAKLIGLKNDFWFVIVAILTLFTVEFRMLNRPEMVSHFLTVLFIHRWLLYSIKPNKFIWVVVGLQILWTNLHEAYSIGLVVSSAFVFGFIMEDFLKTKKLNISKFKIELSVLIFSFLATMIHPYGINMLLHPFEIFGQLGSNKFTTELYDITTSYYWRQPEPYIMGAMVLTFLLFLCIGKIKKQVWLTKMPLGYVFITILFIYLGTTAHRNVPFVAFALTPFLAIFLERAINRKVANYILVSCSIVIFLMSLFVTSNEYYRKTNSRDYFGIGTTTFNNPIGAANFIKENKITGKAFSDYLVSSYLLWELPNFKTYIDLRDLDVFTEGFFNQSIRMTEFPSLFVREDARLDFDYAVLYRPQFLKLHKFFYHSPDWKMAYADGVAAVYVKNERYPNIELGYFRFNEKQIEQSSIAASITKILWPFGDQYFYTTTQDLKNSISYYKSVSAYSEALEQSEVLFNIDKEASLLQKGLVYLALADEAANFNEKQRILSKSVNAFQELLVISPKSIDALFNLGYTLYKSGDFVNAQSFMIKTIKIDKNYFNAYSVLAECQNKFMQTDQRNGSLYEKKWFEYMTKANSIKPNDELTIFKLGISYCQRNQCEKAKPFLNKLEVLPQLTDVENKALLDCKVKCK
tara:strand:+ start:8638 stop:10803 length:2166 start_codon:yes stop_codon:yes gene_type:complete